MNMAETFVAEATEIYGDELLPNEQLPDTLLRLMRFIADDYLPEIAAHVNYANVWLTKHSETGTSSSSTNKSMKSG